MLHLYVSICSSFLPKLFERMFTRFYIFYPYAGVVGQQLHDIHAVVCIQILYVRSNDRFFQHLFCQLAFYVKQAYGGYHIAFEFYSHRMLIGIGEHIYQATAYGKLSGLHHIIAIFKIRFGQILHQSIKTIYLIGFQQQSCIFEGADIRHLFGQSLRITDYYV